jgi:hypothetical protein
MMPRNPRTGHALCCEKGKHLFVEVTRFGIIPKALHDSSVKQSNFFISYDQYSCDHCCVFVAIDAEVCKVCASALTQI